ncbi:hypothetical protein [Sinosporangium siamense]|uniref:Uncharacterized protein n=1 Tax=Sinosporangium siamense TaxID=1367973 RepID=A0A919RDU6_9ACTN|nr:hypothetical protein [Sinosporangium siamense]GII91793.1 hypothetical protein Ssi02_20240 [Sinosporangium siamense]
MSFVLASVLVRPLAFLTIRFPADRYEIAYGGEIADDPHALFSPEELAEEGIALVI